MSENLSFPGRVRADAVIQCAMDMEAAPLLHLLEPMGDEETPRAVHAGAHGHHVQRFALGLIDGARSWSSPPGSARRTPRRPPPEPWCSSTPRS